MQPPFAKRLPVHPLPANLEWVNVARPLDLRDLRGKFVLLDFWTLGCVNCMHIIPELRKLEKAWPDELVVIGVHSAKFTSEKVTNNIKEAALRYGVTHPIVNDSQFEIWKSFGVQAWPTLVLIDPEGYAVWGNSGEATFEQLDAVLRGAAPYYRRRGLLDRKQLDFGKAAAQAATPLRFPGKIAVDEVGGRLFIADSGHNRIAVAKLDGTLIEVIGAGTAGHADGDYATAQFNTPQGMAIDGDLLYVADTENHLIRKVDLARRKVTTIAGTGKQNRVAAPFGRGAKPLGTALSSPWDVLLHNGDLYIAMAGLHEIWKLQLDKPSLRVYAGNGVEDIVDGPIGPRQAYQDGQAAMAQPSGLATDGQWLYAADSEGSSIRAIPFDLTKRMRTVVGTADLASARLFTFGDRDGPADAAQLQHPLGIAYASGKLYVADTYNNKIKQIDPATGETRTLVGSSTAGKSDDPPAFNEPGGIAATSKTLYIADTNNHAIRTVDLAHGNRVATLRIAGLK